MRTSAMTFLDSAYCSVISIFLVRDVDILDKQPIFPAVNVSIEIMEAGAIVLLWTFAVLSCWAATANGAWVGVIVV